MASMTMADGSAATLSPACSPAPTLLKTDCLGRVRTTPERRAAVLAEFEHSTTDPNTAGSGAFATVGINGPDANKGAAYGNALLIPMIGGSGGGGSIGTPGDGGGGGAVLSSSPPALVLISPEMSGRTEDHMPREYGTAAQAARSAWWLPSWRATVGSSQLTYKVRTLRASVVFVSMQWIAAR